MTQPLYTIILDVFGRKPPFLFTFVLSPLAHVIAGRALRGLEGPGMDVLGEIIAADMTPLKDARDLGIMAIPTAAGRILGPSVGALFCEYASWRWIGWVDLPLLGVASPMVLDFLQLQRLESTLDAKMSHLDWIGLGWLSVGCTLIVLPPTWAGTPYPWGSWRMIAMLVLGVVILGLFVVCEDRPQASVMPH